MADETNQSRLRLTPPSKRKAGLPRPSWRHWAVVGLLVGLGTVLHWLGWRPSPPASCRSSASEEDKTEQLPPEEIRRPDGSREHPRIGWEKTDVSLRWIVALIVVASCIAAIHYYGFWRLYWWKERQEREAKQPVSPLTARQTGPLPSPQAPYPRLAPVPSERLPPEPRLDPLNRPSPGRGPANIYLRLAVQERLLHRYGSLPEPGFVHIPIRETMKELAGKLPVHQREVDWRDNGLVDWGESNSGRMFRKGRP